MNQYYNSKNYVCLSVECRGVSSPSMSAYVLSFFDSVRQVKTDVFFGTSADNDEHWRTRTDIGGLEQKLVDSDGHRQTEHFSLKIFSASYSRYVTLKAELPLPSSCCKGEACLPRSHYKGQTSNSKSCAKNSHNVCPPIFHPFLDSLRQRTCFGVISGH